MRSHASFHVFAIAAAVFCAPSLSLAQSAPAPDSASASPIAVVDLEPKQGKLQDLLIAEIAKARAAGLTPFVEIGATWCGPCRKIKAAIRAGDSLMVDAFKGTSIIRLDQDAWEGSLQPLGLVHNAVPVFFAVDSTGKASGAKIDGGAWGEDIPVNMAPPLKKFFLANLKPTHTRPTLTTHPPMH